jgi:hypothetical protein
MIETLSTKQLIRFSHVKHGTLWAWRYSGIIVPAVAGGPGVGHSHRWSYATALGLLMVEAMRATVGINLDTVKRLANTSEAEFESALAAWRGPGYSDEDLWQEEEVASALHQLAGLSAVERELARLFCERSDALFAFYAARLAPESRPTSRVGSRR